MTSTLDLVVAFLGLRFIYSFVSAPFLYDGKTLVFLAGSKAHVGTKAGKLCRGAWQEIVKTGLTRKLLR